MASYKGGKASPGGLLQSGKGMCSYDKNPMSAASRVKPECGPAIGSPANGDQKKANGLLQKAQKQEDSMRGMNGI